MRSSLSSFILIFSVLAFTSSISNAQISVSGFSPSVIIGGMGEKITISGSGFGATRGANFVSFFKPNENYMTSSQGNELNYLSWSDTKIELEMPKAYSNHIRVYIGGSYYLSPDSVHVQANLNNRTTNPREYYLLSANADGEFIWHIHQTYWNNPDIKSAIEEVFKEFRCKTGVNYILASEPSTAQLTLSDGINLIAPQNTGTPGYNSRSWSSCGSFYAYTTQDIEFSDQLDYYYGAGEAPSGKAKFRYILMHELGHSLGLAHVNELGQTMYPTVTNIPSEDWHARDSITSEEKTAMTYYVDLSKGFTSPGCNLLPLGTFFDCNDVYGVATGINDITNPFSFDIYPNPSKGYISLQLNNISVETLKIVNMYGQIVKQINYNGQVPGTISLTEFPSGMYSAILTTKTNTSITRKFVINK